MKSGNLKHYLLNPGYEQIFLFDLRLLSDLVSNYLIHLKAHRHTALENTSEQLNYNQTDLVELTQISERTIRSIEQGNGSSKIEYWWKILDVLGLEMRIQFKPMSDETRKSI